MTTCCELSSLKIYSINFYYKPFNHNFVEVKTEETKTDLTELNKKNDYIFLLRVGHVNILLGTDVKLIPNWDISSNVYYVVKNGVK